MSDCPHCGFHNAADTPICFNCATVLKNKCHNCGAEVPPGDRFCGKCGTPLTTIKTSSREHPAPAAPGMNMQERMMRDLRAKMPSSMVDKFIQGSRELYGQRREVTVLMVEIASFTSITKSIDIETIYLAVDEIIHLLADIVYKYEFEFRQKVVRSSP